MSSLIVNQISGRGLPLIGDDIDTDRIMPARYLKELTFSNLGKYVFADEIIAAEKKGFAHPFVAPLFQGANFLIVNSNFGCGSSREHAPQGIKRWGIDCIIGISFSEIFFSNCYSIGLPCLTVTPQIAEEIQTIIAAKTETQISLDLTAGKLIVAGQAYPYLLDPGLQSAFTTGNWDQTKGLLDNEKLIAKKRQELPYLISNL